ncbi:MAG: acyltransferase family protein [Acidimicrobiales bacterium]
MGAHVSTSGTLRTVLTGTEESTVGASSDAPMAVTGQHLPALDGLRALAVSGVIAYHLDLGWASGGYLGVDLFFVLSGFLITSLLLEEWVSTARIKLVAFWARRARRLLPALFILLAAIGVFVVLYARFGPPGTAAQIDLSELRGDALATLFYVANWHSIFAHQSYFAQFASPSPLEHTWSLAIEEQFYLVWPLVLLLIVTVARRSWRRVGMAVAVVGTLGSAALMAVLFHNGASPTRLYFGTDTHMFDVLLGAAIAMAVAARPQPGTRARRLLHVASPVAAVVLGVFWVTAGTSTGLPRNWMFDGGFLLCALLAGVVVADVRQLHSGPLGRLLSVRPLRWIGTISYGVYLWHWPIIVYLNEQRTGLGQPWLDVVRVGLTLLAATASYYLVERPLRRRRFSGWPRFTVAPLAAVVTAAVVVVATIPAVAVPSGAASTARAVTVDGGEGVPGAGGYQGQKPISLPPFDRAHPLRVTVFGDSVPKVAEPGIAAALGSTGVVKVTNGADTGWGLNRALPDYTWRTGIPSLIAGDRTQLVLATWSWDDSCTPGEAGYRTFTCALQRPAAFTHMLETVIGLMLGPGRADGVIFMEFPPTGPVLATTQTEAQAADATRAAGEAAFNRIIRSMPAVFPGKVMYLPVASSVLLHGRFSDWLPPPTDPKAPKRQWVRVRMVDNVHMCPSGASRYADALLADMTKLFDLPPAARGWSTGSWTKDAVYSTPPGSCPDDHPPG